MKMAEYQHRCEGGGNDVTLDCSSGWNHGELVVILSKRELKAFLSMVIEDIEEEAYSYAKNTHDKLQELLDQIEKL